MFSKNFQGSNANSLEFMITVMGKIKVKAEELWKHATFSISSIQNTIWVNNYISFRGIYLDYSCLKYGDITWTGEYWILNSYES